MCGDHEDMEQRGDEELDDDAGGLTATGRRHLFFRRQARLPHILPSAGHKLGFGSFSWLFSFFFVSSSLSTPNWPADQRPPSPLLARSKMSNKQLKQSLLGSSVQANSYEEVKVRSQYEPGANFLHDHAP